MSTQLHATIRWSQYGSMKFVLSWPPLRVVNDGVQGTLKEEIRDLASVKRALVSPLRNELIVDFSGDRDRAAEAVLEVLARRMGVSRTDIDVEYVDARSFS